MEQQQFSFTQLKKGLSVTMELEIPNSYRTYRVQVRCHTDLSVSDCNRLDQIAQTMPQRIIKPGDDAISIIKSNFLELFSKFEDLFPASTYKVDSWSAEMDLRRYADEYTDADETATVLLIAGGSTAALGGALYGVGAVLPETRPPGGGADNTLIVYTDTKHELKQAGLVFAAVGGVVAVPALGYKTYKWASRKLKDRKQKGK
jgi:hypothetical protein